jgi:glycosyltransferase involved in cell wall biosynthesis
LRSDELSEHGLRQATSARIRLGLYSHASRIGGAETYLRDVALGMDPTIFDVHVFVPPWQEFIEFLGIDGTPGVDLHIVRVVEPATAFTDDRSWQPALRQQPSFGTESHASRVRRVALAMRLPPPALRLGHDALRYLTMPVNRPRLAAAFAPYDLDVLHVINGGYPGAASALAAVLAGRRTARSRVMTVCSTAMPRSILEPVERVADGRVRAGLDAMIVPGRRPGAALVRRGFRRDKMEIIPWGARSLPAVIDPGARVRLDLPSEGPVIVCLANFTPTKGQRVVVDAMPALVARFPGIRAVLAGDGPELQAVRDRADSLGLDATVRFPGPFTEPWDLLRAADVFVLASEMEGLPLVILEAMSQGVPVVATDVGGIPEAVIDGETGFLIAPRDAGAVANAVARILEAPILAQRMRQAALARFEQRFTMQSMLDSHRELYVRLADAGRARDGHRP